MGHSNYLIFSVFLYILLQQIFCQILIQQSDSQTDVITKFKIPMQIVLPDSQFKEYPIRYFIVFIFALSQFMISVLLNTLNPIAAYLGEIYGEKPLVVNLGGLLFALMHPIFTFPASYVIDTFGTRAGIALGCVLALIGVCLRMLINQSFAWVIVGQVVAGIGRPFILNCQAKISANWFSATNRGAITQLLTLVLNVSLVIGIIIPVIVFGGYKPQISNPQNIQQGKDLTFKLMLIQAIMAFICFVANIFFQQKAPPTPPSASGAMQRQKFSQAIPKMLKNVNYILLLIAFFLYFGIFNAISIVLSYLIQPFFSGDSLAMATAAVGGSPIISGIIGVLVLGPLQRKEGVFKKWIIICMAGSLFATAIFYPLLLPQILAVASFISAFNSFFLIPLVPIMLQLGCQLVFPVGEGSAVGLLFAVGNFGGFLLGIILSMIAQGDSKAQTAGGIGFCFGMQLIGLILIYFMKQQKNRQKAEQQQIQRRRSSRISILTSDSSYKSALDSAKQDKNIRDSLLDKKTASNTQRQSDNDYKITVSDQTLDNPLL